ncbi:MAG: OmpA family protein [Bacteroidia bacterium]|nr:OmpA family protein [Bacteroidia bacterium]
MIRPIFLLLALSIAASPLKAQDFTSYFNSNYSGIFGVHLNPASIADSRHRFDMTLVGASIGFQNNYIGLKRDALDNGDHGKFYFGEGSYPAFSEDEFQDKYLFERQDNLRKSVFFYSNIYLPSFQISFKDRSAFGFSWRERNYLNIDGVEPNLAHQIYLALEDSVQWNEAYHNEKFSAQFMSWAEYNFTYARVLKDEDASFIKAGASLKLLQGLGALYMFVNDLHYEVNHEDTITLINSHIQYGHSTNLEFDANKLKYKYISNINFGLDLGVIYEYRPERSKFRYEMDGEKDLDMRYANKYKFKAGFSIMDIGGMRFNKGSKSRNFTANVTDWYIDTLDFHGQIIEGVDTTTMNFSLFTFDDTLFNRFPQEPEDKSFFMNTPTVINTMIDYNIWKDFYACLNIYWALQMKKNPHKVHEISTFSLTPRWDWKWLGVYLPLSYNAYRNFNTGIDLRLGPLFIGTNSLAGLFGKRDVYGADFHFLLRVPILYRKPKDKDLDKVSDKKDKCKDVPGVWEFAGCPDRDGDHIEDVVDVCPDDPGLKEFNGCPDRDGDKIIDKEDACPDDKGLAEYRGCPDRDGDRIIDKEDDCPDEPGVVMFRGCPDTDGDSIMDKHDKCPTKAGPLENQGCPIDRLFLVDQNGRELGVSTKNGEGNFLFPQLPPDEIAMFKLETYNEPPEILEVRAGTGTIVRVAKKGKDGYFRFEVLKPDPTKLNKLNEKDKVVVLTKEEEEVLKKAFDNLEFESGKDIIKPESYASLNELAGLMKKKGTWKLKVSGHTDNVGAPAKNLELSKKRANAVKKYLAAQGIQEERFIVKWYGQTQPVASNKTPEGRQKNRRVEMLIIE